eukprot:jgi/Mesvir1/29730/Mv00959-RA.1
MGHQSDTTEPTLCSYFRVRKSYAETQVKALPGFSDQKATIAACPSPGQKTRNNAAARTQDGQHDRICGIPERVIDAYKRHCNVSTLFPWQRAAIECGKDGTNLVYCAPTSGGKSLVAEILLIRKLVRSGHDPGQKLKKSQRRDRPLALVVLPYISLVSEKAAHLKKVLAAMHADVCGFYGGGGPQPLARTGESVAVCTIEKASITINRLLEEGRIDKLACVVIDELHMAGASGRGSTLESLLTKLMFCRTRHGAAKCQIIGMSATMRNVDVLAMWLDARLFSTNFRPTSLYEYAKVKGDRWLYDRDMHRVWEVHPDIGGDGDGDDNHLVALCAEPLLREDAGQAAVLVFCSSRSKCERTALFIAERLPGELASRLQKERKALVHELRLLLDGKLPEDTVTCAMAGVAFHHAGITTEERACIEGAYRSGVLNILACTSTLAAGVNLPAQRVVIRSLQQAGGLLDAGQYRQMAGRAGRTGLCQTFGEAIIMVEERDKLRTAARIMAATAPDVASQLLVRGTGAGGGGTAGHVNGGSSMGASVPANTSLHGRVNASGVGVSPLLPLSLSQVAAAAAVSTAEICSPVLTPPPLPTPPSLPGTNGPALPGTPKTVVTDRLPNNPGNAANGGVAAVHADDRSLRCEGLRHLLLETISTGLVSTPTDIQGLLECTLVKHQHDFGLLRACTVATLRWLTQEDKLIKWVPDDKGGHYSTRDAGKAVYASCLPPATSVYLYEELRKAQSLLVLDDDLHLMFLITPLEHPISINNWAAWDAFLSRHCRLGTPRERIARMCGVEEGYVNSRRMGSKGVAAVTNTHCRFAAAFALTLLMEETPYTDVEELFAPITEGSLTRGTLQSLQEDASKYAVMVTSMCHAAGWGYLEALVSIFQGRLQAGVKRELLPLMKVPGLSARHARALYDKGIRTPQQLANADPAKVERVLKAALPTFLRRRSSGVMTPAVVTQAPSDSVPAHDKASALDSARTPCDPPALRVANPAPDDSIGPLDREPAPDNDNPVAHCDDPVLPPRTCNNVPGSATSPSAHKNRGQGGAAPAADLTISSPPRIPTITSSEGGISTERPAAGFPGRSLAAAPSMANGKDSVGIVPGARWQVPGGMPGGQGALKAGASSGKKRKKEAVELAPATKRYLSRQRESIQKAAKAIWETMIKEAKAELAAAEAIARELEENEGGKEEMEGGSTLLGAGGGMSGQPWGELLDDPLW